jgi:hypothetical protein
VNKRLSADNGVTAADDMRGRIRSVGSDGFSAAAVQQLKFEFDTASHLYAARLPETIAATYQLNVSVRNQLGSGAGPHWEDIVRLTLPTGAAVPAVFVVVPAPADASSTEFGGCYYGTSTRADGCYCVAGVGCRTLQDVANRLTIVVRDQYENVRDPTVIAKITKPRKDPGDVVTADVVGAGLVEYSPPAWVVSNSSYVFEFVMKDRTEWSYTLNVTVNGELAETVPYRYAFHTNLNVSKCEMLRCDEFYEPSRFRNFSRWTAEGSTIEQQCRTAGCLSVSEPLPNAPNTLSITLADALSPNGHVRANVVGLCLMNDTSYDPNATFLDSKGRGFCMARDDSGSCNATRLDCYSQADIEVLGARNGAEATVYSVGFRVPHPGWYGVSVELKDGAGARHRDDMVRILIGPGRPDLRNSWFQMLTARREAKEGRALQFEVRVQDQDGDPRYGLDEVLVQLTRLPIGSELLDQQDQSLQPPTPMTMTLMTRQSKLRSLVDAPDIGLIPTGSRAGRYVVTQKFTPGHVGSKGVFLMRVWVCGPTNKTCTMTPENEILQPHDPKSPDDSTLTFTVCPSNASISADIDGAISSALSECKCDAGYSGPDGKSCSACGPGKFKKDQGARDCSVCTAGTHCSCQVDPLRPDAQECTNPCKQCDACAVNYYQNQYGQKDCVACPKINSGAGFLCPLEGMTWPLAKPGYWISGSNPSIFHDCAARPAACPGSPFAANSSRLNALRKIGSNTDLSVDADALQATCFLRSQTMSDDVSHSGWQVLPHGGVQTRYQSEETAAVVDCWDFVGSNCAQGYSGAQQNKACVDCDHAGSGYFPDSSQNLCVACPADSGWVLATGFVAGSLILAPITIRFAGMAKHAGALTAPLMSLINFLQSIDLFRQLQLQWPQSIKTFILRIASFFNLNINILGIHPECSFHLKYYQKWGLKMLSPVGVIVSLAVAIFVRRWAANRARNLAQVGTHLKRRTGDITSSIRSNRDMAMADVAGSDQELHLVDEILSRGRPTGDALAPTAGNETEIRPAGDTAAGGLNEPLYTTVNSVGEDAMNSSRRSMPANKANVVKKRHFCIKLGCTLMGGIIGVALGWTLTGAKLLYCDRLIESPSCFVRKRLHSLCCS